MLGVDQVTLNRFENSINPAGVTPAHLLTRLFNISPYWLWIGDLPSARHIPDEAVTNLNRFEIVQRTAQMLVKDVYQVYTLAAPGSEPTMLGESLDRYIPLTREFADQTTHCLICNREDETLPVGSIIGVDVGSTDAIPGQMVIAWSSDRGSYVYKVSDDQPVPATVMGQVKWVTTFMDPPKVAEATPAETEVP